MTDREKIIALAVDKGAVSGVESHLNMDGDSIVFNPEELEAFYHAAQKEAFERAACICDKHSDDPVYCGEAIRQLIKE